MSPSDSKKAVNQKVDPCPRVLSTSISPWKAATISRLIARPSPKPPERRVVVWFAWVKGRKSWVFSSADIPIPVSSISKRRPVRLPEEGSCDIRTMT